MRKAEAQVKISEIPSKLRGLYEPHRYKALHGGRGSAKSHGCAQASLILGTQRSLGIGCFREVQRSIAASVKRLLDQKIAAMQMQSFYTSTDTEIRGANGTWYMFAGLRTNPDSVKSTEGLDIAWVEEASAVSQRSWDILTPTVRKPNSEIWATWNRTKLTDPVDKMFHGGEPPPGSWIQELNWRDNPFFPDVLRDEMEWDKRRDHDKYLHVWEGHPLKRSEARVFSNFEQDDLDEYMPPGLLPQQGADWGFAKDPTVLVRCYVWGRTLYFRNEAWKIGCKIADTPALFRTIPDSHRYPIISDSARPETIAHMRDNDFPLVKKARKGARSVEEGVEFIKSFDVVIHPDCPHVLSEFQNYSYKIDKQTDEVTNELADRENHTIDAARYALENVRRRQPGEGVATAGPSIITPEDPEYGATLAALGRGEGQMVWSDDEYADPGF